MEMSKLTVEAAEDRGFKVEVVVDDVRNALGNGEVIVADNGRCREENIRILKA